ncbi:MAG: NAD(+) diphosphatase [Pseudomonadota bacterium]
MSSKPSFGYTSLPLARLSAERKNPQWVAAQLDNPASLIYCLNGEKNLFAANTEKPTPVVLRRDESNEVLQRARRPIFLGMRERIACFAVDLGRGPEAPEVLPPESEFVDLRSVATLLGADDASLLAYARGLVYWHAYNQFCGSCGAATYGAQAGHSRRCSNSECAREIFPRTDPAVIMLVEDLSDPKNPKALLGRNKRFAARMFSTLAGFVDPGETLEACVAREVYEEVGVHVENVRYQASQPWPFPASIMLGFRATATSKTIDTDADEIEEAYWFSARELQTFGEWGDGQENNCLPRKDSIARYLVDSWIDDVLA